MGGRDWPGGVGGNGGSDLEQGWGKLISFAQAIHSKF